MGADLRRGDALRSPGEAVTKTRQENPPDKCVNHVQNAPRPLWGYMGYAAGFALFSPLRAEGTLSLQQRDEAPSAKSLCAAPPIPPPRIPGMSPDSVGLTHLRGGGVTRCRGADPALPMPATAPHPGTRGGRGRQHAPLPVRPRCGTRERGGPRHSAPLRASPRRSAPAAVIGGPGGAGARGGEGGSAPPQSRCCRARPCAEQRVSAAGSPAPRPELASACSIRRGLLLLF